MLFQEAGFHYVALAELESVTQILQASSSLCVAPTGIEFNSYPASASQVVGNYPSVPLCLAHRLLKSKWDFELDTVVLPIILAAGESEAGVWFDSS